MKFIADILNRFQFTKQTRNCVTESVYIQELWFLHSAHPLMLVYVFMKFHDCSLDGLKLKRGHEHMSYTYLIHLDLALTSLENATIIVCRILARRRSYCINFTYCIITVMLNVFQ